MAKAVELLEIEPTVIEQALAVQLTSGNLVWEQIGEQPLIFLPHLVRAERDIAQRIARLIAAKPTYPPIDFEKAVAWSERRTGKQLAPSQREAVREILRNRIAVVTGGPGVGKTTLVQSILTILRAKQVHCVLCAADRAGGQTAHGSNGCGSQNDPPLAGNSAGNRPVLPE